MSILSVRTPSDTQVEVSRSFASSLALVWRWRSEADGEFGFVGEFREIEPHAKIVHTEGLRDGSPGAEVAGGTLVTITFEEVSGATTIE
jgi:uncharacterized protein YndB with AHSA1/START domain